MKRVREIILDFTPLLDVTLIILFYFILFSHMGAAEVQQKAEQRMQEASAAHSAAENRMQEAEALMQEAAFQRKMLEDADEKGAAIEQALEDYAAGRNLKLLMQMNAGEWVLRVRRGNERDAIAVLRQGDSADALEAALREAGCLPENVLLCELIYDADEDGTNQAYQAMKTILDTVRESYPHMYISETDLSK